MGSVSEDGDDDDDVEDSRQGHMKKETPFYQAQGNLELCLKELVSVHADGHYHMCSATRSLSRRFVDNLL